MDILLWVIFGAIAGWIASLLTGEGSRMDATSNIAVGIAGALIGGWLAILLGGSGITGFNIGSLLIAIAGSALLILIIRSLARS